jgi:hypothetical protein
MNKLLLIGLLAISVSTASAHGPDKGKNGGQMADAGDYHVEVVVNDTSLTVYINDQSDKALPTVGFKGTAILVVDGKAERFPLVPENENKLTGTAAVPLKAPIKGAIQITNSSNKTAQAKF